MLFMAFFLVKKIKDVSNCLKILKGHVFKKLIFINFFFYLMINEQNRLIDEFTYLLQKREGAWPPCFATPQVVLTLNVDE